MVGPPDLTAPYIAWTGEAVPSPEEMTGPATCKKDRHSTTMRESCEGPLPGPKPRRSARMRQSYVGSMPSKARPAEREQGDIFLDFGF